MQLSRSVWWYVQKIWIKFIIHTLFFFSWLGDLCELDYNGCTSGSACKINWNNQTTCIPLTAAQQIAQNRSYICNGTCEAGYTTTDNFTCSGKYLWKKTKEGIV